MHCASDLRIPRFPYYYYYLCNKCNVCKKAVLAWVLSLTSVLRRLTVRLTPCSCSTAPGSYDPVVTAPAAVFPLTTTDPASELALKLRTCTEAIRMVPDLSMASSAAQAQVVAALIHASAIAELADAIRTAGGLVQSGFCALGECLPE
jgi:hypothetical protein